MYDESTHHQQQQRQREDPAKDGEPKSKRFRYDDKMDDFQRRPKYVDPVKAGEPKFALFSFIKAPDVVPDASGFFGVAKIRGAFYTEKEAAERADELVRDVDSTNSIFTCQIGHPFPLVVKGLAAELTEIDLRDKTAAAISQNVRDKRDSERKEMKEIEDRREELMRDVDPATEKCPLDVYVEQRVKLAHLRYAIVEHESKQRECQELADKVRAVLIQQSTDRPELEEGYMDRYKTGRRAANIPEGTDLCGFMKYMADPI